MIQSGNVLGKTLENILVNLVKGVNLALYNGLIALLIVKSYNLHSLYICVVFLYFCATLAFKTINSISFPLIIRWNWITSILTSDEVKTIS